MNACLGTTRTTLLKKPRTPESGKVFKASMPPKGFSIALVQHCSAAKLASYPAYFFSHLSRGYVSLVEIHTVYMYAAFAFLAK